MNTHDETTDDELIDGGAMMSLFDHLAELRTVLVRSALCILVLFCASFYFSKPIIEFIKLPLMKVLPEGNNLTFIGITDPFVASIKVAFLTSVIGSCPVWLYQFWSFLEPGLYPKERRLILPFAISSIVLFLCGITFCFTLILPMALDFMITYGQQYGVATITIDKYLSFVTILIFAFGLVFETPVILVLLALLDLIDAKMLREFRPLVLIAILVVGALLTPPDPISQVAMAVPVYLMYEASIIIISIIKREPKTEETSLAKT